MRPDDSALEAAVGGYVDPLVGASLAASGALRGVQASAGALRVSVELGFPVGGYERDLRDGLAAHLRGQGIDHALELRLSARIPSFVGNRGVAALPGIGNVIAIASGKGGVGKSTVAANLALALARQGARVGLLDADIYGPSQPRMMGLAGQKPTTTDGRTLEPPVGHGIRVMSIGFLVDDEQPMVWRGPMVSQALSQLLSQTHWGELDYLLVDMPPGTGDTQLTLSQRVPLAGAVIVTTPQDIALLDARKGLMMFRKVEVPVLGIVENMSLHRCPACGHESHIFGAGGGRGMAERYGVELLGELPLELAIREQADSGCPTVAAAPDSPAGLAYQAVARRAAAALARIAAAGAAAFPTIRIEDEA